MHEPCFIDTNILMYAVGTDHPLKKPCLNILEQVSEGRILAVTDTEVFQEIAYRYWSQHKWKIAVDVLKDYESLFSYIYPIEQNHLQHYYRLLSQYDFLSPRDAIHIAVMDDHHIRMIYTADKAFQKMSTLQVIIPEKSF